MILSPLEIIRIHLNQVFSLLFVFFLVYLAFRVAIVQNLKRGIRPSRNGLEPGAPGNRAHPDRATLPRAEAEPRSGWLAWHPDEVALEQEFRDLHGVERRPLAHVVGHHP